MKLIFITIQSFSIISALMVILTPNPVHSVLFLIFTFLNVSLLVSFLGQYYIALLFLIIYVGAIAILFLFIIMMINIKIKTIALESKWSLLFTSFFLILVFVFSLLILIDQYLLELDSEDIALLTTQVSYLVDFVPHYNYLKEFEDTTTAELLGQVLYTHYFIGFVIAGMILLVAMIGAIVLTQDRTPSSTLKQQVYQQVSRNAENAIFKIS